MHEQILTPIESQELLARFAYQSNHFRPVTLTPKPKLFLPEKNPLETSVVRHLSYSQEDLWGFGRYIVSQKNQATLYGRADIKAEAVDSLKLKVVAGGDDPKLPSHAGIVGWPHEKDAQMDIANVLAREAGQLILPG